MLSVGRHPSSVLVDPALFEGLVDVALGRLDALSVVGPEHDDHRFWVETFELGDEVGRPVEVVRPGESRRDAVVEGAGHQVGLADEPDERLAEHL